MNKPATTVAADLDSTTGLDSAGLDSTGLESAGLDSTGLESADLNASQENNLQSIPETKNAMAAGIWNAHLELDIARSSRGVRLMRSKHRGPLYVQKALYPEGDELPHLYLLHPPGGLVSGDQLDLQINVGENSSALLTSPGAGRLYGARADQRAQRQHNQLRLKAKSSLEWFPMEMLVYSGANAETRTQVHLDEDSHFIGWDICALGLPASAAPFVQGSLRQAFEIYLSGKAKIIERIAFQAADQRYRDSLAGLAGYSCNALFVAGPFTDDTEREQVQNSLAELCRQISTDQRDLDKQAAGQADKQAGGQVDGQTDGHIKTSKSSSAPTPMSGKAPMMGVTQQGDWLVIRYLGDSSTLAREAFVKSWQLVRPSLLGRDPCLPRIWAC